MRSSEKSRRHVTTSWLCFVCHSTQQEERDYAVKAMSRLSGIPDKVYGQVGS
jgi:hypothetical protein